MGGASYSFRAQGGKWIVARHNSGQPTEVEVTALIRLKIADALARKQWQEAGNEERRKP